MAGDRTFYGLAKFAEGESVRVLDRNVLKEFMTTWKYHHNLVPEQIEYADRISKVKRISMYHGGDILYELENIPGIWHQHLLASATQPSDSR